jgi:predicted transcriptional regulator
MAKSLTEMAADIVTAQASHSLMSADEIGEALKKTFESLQCIQCVEEFAAEMVAEQEPVAADPKKSIQRNKITCLECGKEFKQLTNRHLKEHKIDAKAYRKKWGLPAGQPLSAKSLTAKRRKTAKDLGLGEKLKTARKAKGATARTPAAAKGKARAKVVRRRRKIA